MTKKQDTDALADAAAWAAWPCSYDYPERDAYREGFLAALRSQTDGEGFQSAVAAWMLECFTPEIADDTLERNDRFIEEALELVQSLGYSADRAHSLIEYVFNRPKGEPSQEVGGVMVTLAALCEPNGLDMMGSAATELARINHPDVIQKIRAKQASKPFGSALPTPPAQGDK